MEFIAPERLETAEFVLRSYHPGDGPLLKEASESSYAHLKTFMPWATPTLSQAQAEQIVRRMRGQWLCNNDFVVAIVSPDEQTLLGGCGFHLREGRLEEGRAEIGMWIRASASGRGLGTQVLRSMLRWGFEDWGWNRLSWHCSSLNVASQRCAEKAGMRKEAVLRGARLELDGETISDTVIYGLLAQDWREDQGATQSG